MVFCVLLLSSCLFFGSSLLADTWDLCFHWEGLPTGYATWNLLADKTFKETETGQTGTWSVTGSTFNLKYDISPYSNYVGTVRSDRNYIVGTMTNNNGWSGTWYAYRSGYNESEAPKNQEKNDSEMQANMP
jgi:hypothetical protein